MHRKIVSNKHRRLMHCCISANERKLNVLSIRSVFASEAGSETFVFLMLILGSEIYFHVNDKLVIRP